MPVICKGGRIMTTRYKFNSYVIDDGWNLPKEVLEEIEYKVVSAKNAALRKVVAANKAHKGLWLTQSVVDQYQAKSWVYRVLEDNQYCGMVRQIGQELQEKYGVTELEAINILNGHNVKDYLNKYYRIRHKIPAEVNEQRICDMVVSDYRALNLS